MGRNGNTFLQSTLATLPNPMGGGGGSMYTLLSKGKITLRLRTNHTPFTNRTVIPSLPLQGNTPLLSAYSDQFLLSSTKWLTKKKLQGVIKSKNYCLQKKKKLSLNTKTGIKCKQKEKDIPCSLANANNQKKVGEALFQTDFRERKVIRDIKWGITRKSHFFTET